VKVLCANILEALRSNATGFYSNEYVVAIHVCLLRTILKYSDCLGPYVAFLPLSRVVRCKRDLKSRPTCRKPAG